MVGWLEARGHYQLEGLLTLTKKLPSIFFGNDPKGINIAFFWGGWGAFLGECIVGRSEVFPSSPDVPALPVHAGHHKDDCSFSKGGTFASHRKGRQTNFSNETEKTLKVRASCDLWDWYIYGQATSFAPEFNIP